MRAPVEPVPVEFSDFKLGGYLKPLSEESYPCCLLVFRATYLNGVITFSRVVVFRQPRFL